MFLGLVMPKNVVWVSVLVKFGILLVILLLFNFGVVAVAGSEIWSKAAYLFGQDVGTTVCTFMFIEGGLLLVFGSLWASVSMRNIRYGLFGKIHDSVTRKDWEERREMVEKPNEAIIVSLLTGGVMLVSSIMVLLM